VRVALTLLAVSAFVALADASAAQAQTIKGFVRDNTTGQPIADASLVLLDDDGKIQRGTLSEPNGFYELPVPKPGKYTLRVGAAGYDARDMPPVECKADETLELDITIWAAGLSGALQGFNARKEKGEGVFVTREELDEFGSSRFTEVMRNIPAVDVVPLPGNEGSHTVRVVGGNFRTERIAGVAQRAAAVQRVGEPDQDCPPVLWMDGKWWGSIDEADSAGPDAILLPPDIQGIEIYNHPSILPERFDTGRDSLCGVIVVWTKQGS
jgi:hypothetical protein